MSRTEKDRPWWYQAPYWTPRHIRCEHDTRAWFRAVIYGPPRTCDLPDAPVIARDAPRPGTGGIRNRRCYWWPHWPFRCTCDYCRPRHQGIGERAAVRAYRRRVMAEHRATGTVDAELPTGRWGPRWCDW